MNVKQLLDNELKRVNKILHRLNNMPKGSVKEKDLERFRKELEEYSDYKKDILTSISVIKDNEKINRPTTGLSRATGPAWGIHHMCSPSSPYTLRYNANPVPTPVPDPVDERPQEYGEYTGHTQAAVSEAIFRSWEEVAQQYRPAQFSGRINSIPASALRRINNNEEGQQDERNS